MSLEKYQLTVDDENRIFEFISKGKKGDIVKRIRFMKSHIDDDLYNLEFGDAKAGSNEMNYMVASDNGDTMKVLATVAESVRAFLDSHPSGWIYAEGSTQSRTRLYQMNINRFFSEISNGFEVYGLNDGEWKTFSSGLIYEAFLVGKRRCIFNYKFDL